MQWLADYLLAFTGSLPVCTSHHFFKGVHMSQNKSILKALKSGKSITQVQAYKKFGCTRLAARIADLRACGHSISMSWVVSNGKRYGSYSMSNKDAA